jgi:hypothetical protein
MQISDQRRLAFSQLGNAGRRGASNYLFSYVQNLNSVLGLYGDGKIRRGNLEAEKKDELVTLAKVSVVLNDISFANLMNPNPTIALGSAANLILDECPPFIGAHFQGEEYAAALLRESEHTGSVLFVDSQLAAAAHDLAPLADRGRIVFQPNRYVVTKDIEQSKIEVVEVPQDSADHWNWRPSETAEPPLQFEANESGRRDERLLFDIVVPFVDGLSSEDLAKLLDDEEDVLIEFRAGIRALTAASQREGRDAQQILADVVRPQVARMERRFRNAVNMNRLKIAGAAISTATIGLVSFWTTGLAAGVTAVAGASGLLYLTKEIASGIGEANSIKDDACYLLLRLKSISR